MAPNVVERLLPFCRSGFAQGRGRNNRREATASKSSRRRLVGFGNGQGLPRAVPRSRSRGVAAPQGNAHRRALEYGTQHHRRQEH